MNTTEGANAPEVVHMAYGHFNGESFEVPLAMCSTYNGVRGWHKLSDEERAVHGWYPAKLINSTYDSITQVREAPSCTLVDGVIHAEYTIRDKTKEELLAVQKAFVHFDVQQKMNQWPVHKGITATQDLVAKLPIDLLKAGLVDKVDWHHKDEWITLTHQDVMKLSTLASLHIQACFSARRAVEEALHIAEDVMAYPIKQKLEEYYSEVLARADNEH